MLVWLMFDASDDASNFAHANVISYHLKLEQKLILVLLQLFFVMESKIIGNAEIEA